MLQPQLERCTQPKRRWGQADMSSQPISHMLLAELYNVFIVCMMCFCVLVQNAHEQQQQQQHECLGYIVWESQTDSKVIHELIIMANLLFPFDCWDLCAVHNQSQLHNSG